MSLPSLHSILRGLTEGTTFTLRPAPAGQSSPKPIPVPTRSLFTPRMLQVLPAGTATAAQGSTNNAKSSELKSEVTVVKEVKNLNEYGRVWTSAAVHALIRLRTQLNQDFEDVSQKRRKRHLWKRISENLSSLGHGVYSADVCANKWRTLLVTFRKAEEPGSICSLTWEYYNDMVCFRQKTAKLSSVSRVECDQDLKYSIPESGTGDVIGGIKEIIGEDVQLPNVHANVKLARPRKELLGPRPIVMSDIPVFEILINEDKPSVQMKKRQLPFDDTDVKKNKVQKCVSIPNEKYSEAK